MNILSQDEKILVNYDNVDSLYIQKMYQQYSHPDTWWEIRAMHTTTSDVLAKFDDESECTKVFYNVIRQICEQKKNIIFIKPVEFKELNSFMQET